MLDAAEAVGLPVRVAPMPASLPTAELYLASTLKELSPVVSVDGEPRPGRGPVGTALHAAFRKLVQQECSDQGAAATS
jgi:hypothetical protein